MVCDIVRALEARVATRPARETMTGAQKRFQVYKQLAKQLGYTGEPEARIPIPFKYTDVVEAVYGQSRTGFKHR